MIVLVSQVVFNRAEAGTGTTPVLHSDWTTGHIVDPRILRNYGLKNDDGPK